MAAGDLTTLTNVTAWVPGIDSATGVRLITAISTQIQNWVSYDFASKSYTRTFNGRGGERLMLPDFPVTAVVSVMIDGVSVPASSAPTQSGFVFDEKTIYLRGWSFCRGVQNVTVGYTAGYATIPGDVEQACLEWIKATYDRLDRVAGVTKLKAGGSEIDYGPDAFVAGSELIAPMPAAVFALLQPYARVFTA